MNYPFIQWGIMATCVFITGCNSSDIDSNTSNLNEDVMEGINSSINNDLSNTNVSSANNGNSMTNATSSRPVITPNANPIITSSSMPAASSSARPTLTSSSNPGSSSSHSSTTNSHSSTTNSHSSTSRVNSSPDGSLAIDSVYPTSDAMNRALVTKVTIEFNSDILADSFDNNLIALKHNGNHIAGLLTQHKDNGFTFTPSKTLAPYTTYTVDVSAQIMSQEGLNGEGFSWAFTTTGDLGETSQTVIDACMSARDISMLDSVNKARSQSRVCGNEFKAATTKIRWNCLVEDAAQIHSDDMASKNFFDHTGSDGSSAGDRITRVGYNWRGWSENIAAGQPDVNSVMLGWLESPDHCKNIMNTGHKEFGLGYTVNNNTQYRLYWTQNFATAR